MVTPATVPQPSVKLSPYNIRYLAFQGGGGKGLAYLGALSWLEQYGLTPNATPVRPAPLPLYQPNQPAGQTIAGLSGASAGAITAFLVTLGYRSSDMKAALRNADLVDKPALGAGRGVPSDFQSQPPSLIPDTTLIRAYILNFLASAGVTTLKNPLINALIASEPDYA